MGKKFVVVPLEDERAKRIAQVMASSTSRKILGFLSDADGGKATESEIAQGLGMGLTTDHYNVKGLLDAGLVERKSFKYSEKGNKVFAYGVAEKHVLISPRVRGMSVVKRELSRILPVAVISGIVGGLIKLIYNPVALVAEPVLEMAGEVAGEVPEKMVERAEAVDVHIGEVVAAVGSDAWLWFLGGALLAVVIYLIIAVLWKRR